MGNEEHYIDLEKNYMLSVWPGNHLTRGGGEACVAVASCYNVKILASQAIAIKKMCLRRTGRQSMETIGQH